jgi:hypothetical protein
MIRARSLTLLCILLATSACSERTTVPSQVAQLPLTAQASTQVFSGTLSPAGSQLFAFTIGNAPVRVSLGSLTDANGNPLQQSLRLTFGVPQGTGCGSIQSATTSASLSTHLQVLVSGGTYCVSVSDIGQLSTTATFGVRITLGDPSTRAGAGTVTYAQTVLPKGSTSRTFDASLRGDVTIFFDTIDPGSVPSLGLGVGFPRSDGGGCVLNQSFTATRGSQFTFPVEAGTYCLQVFDAGTLTGPAQFSLRIQHP